MGGKGKKKGKKQKQAASPTAAVEEEGGCEGGETNGGKKGKKGKKGKAGKSSKFQGDIFSEAAMENAYYVCHNLMDVLKARGFAWPEGQKKKKKERNKNFDRRRKN
ncbi:hypothetical protein PVAND_005412 [Polypedilum vanderplanki]|uniref:Small lysine-rich protein 1 n=1 Tax=Polypedilum vanderplanki TaxID=319348 RepID=A0A9J6C035_POLVA|nr:hypothetical protein PVAND_005412 [Polypedilum vanderplanki]